MSKLRRLEVVMLTRKVQHISVVIKMLAFTLRGPGFFFYVRFVNFIIYSPLLFTYAQALGLSTLHPKKPFVAQV